MHDARVIIESWRARCMQPYPASGEVVFYNFKPWPRVTIKKRYCCTNALPLKLSGSTGIVMLTFLAFLSVKSEEVTKLGCCEICLFSCWISLSVMKAKWWMKWRWEHGLQRICLLSLVHSSFFKRWPIMSDTWWLMETSVEFIFCCVSMTAQCWKTCSDYNGTMVEYVK